MAKPNFQDILLKKGDKIALGVGAALVGSLGLWGVVNFATADSPSSLVKQFDTKAAELKRQVAAEGTDAPDLPAWVMKGADKVPIDSTQFALAGPPFEPVFTPSTLRNNPKVLAIDDVQFDYLRIPMRANDIRIGPDGVAEVGVKVNASKGETDPAKLAQNLKGLQGVLGRNGKQPDQFNRRAPAPPAPGARAPGTGGFPGGLPGAGPGGISGSGSGSSGGPPGGIPGGPRGGSSGGPPGGIPRGGSSGGPPGGFGGGSSGGPPGGFGGDAGISSSGGGTADQTVVYVSADEVAKKGLTMAETVYPLRAVVVTATFPIKKQLDEIRQALRAKTNEEAARLAAGPGGTDGPTFAGFEVDRQVLSPGGTWSEWLPFDHKADYQRSIYSRAVDTVPDSGYLAYFVQPGDQEMVYLLPAIADGLGEYKKITLRSVIDQIAKLKALNAVEPTKSDLEKRLSGGAGNNMFAPISGGGAATGTSGGSYPPSMGVPGFGPGSGSSSGAPRPPSPGGSDGSSVPPGGAARLQNQINPGLDIIDHTLLRFIDSDVQPGFSYRYRVKVKMRNPNFGKPTLVSSPDDAKQEVLEGPWQAIPDVFSVPGDNFLYAHDSAEYADSSMKIVESYGKEPAFRKFMEVDEVTAGRKAVVEIQRWMPGVRVGGASSTKVEPVGTWVVAKVPVGPGEFIGKRQFLELPLWSGGLGNYVLRELAGGLKIAGVKDPKHQPRGWPLNFGTASVLIDFEGGKTTKVRVNDRDVADDSDSELLIVQPDGKLVVLNSGTDGANKDRKERDAVWTDWVTRVKDRRDVSVPGTGMPAPPGVGGGFGKPGGI